MSRFNTIVAALDLYPAADRALPLVARLARAGSLPVELLTVLDENVRHWGAAAELELRADRYGLGRTERFVLRAPSPGSEIVDHVMGRDGVLLVMATTACGGWDEHKLGPVTDEVLGRARQPVVVVGPRAEPSTGLLVVVDADGGVDAAIPVVERWLATFDGGAPQVIEVRATDSWPGGQAGRVAGCVDRYVDELGERGFVASGEVLRGSDPVGTIIDHATASGAGVVVVTCPHDPGQSSHWFSTTRRLIRFAPRPVFVVPAESCPAAWH